MKNTNLLEVVDEALRVVKALFAELVAARRDLDVLMARRFACGAEEGAGRRGGGEGREITSAFA